jgi:hypothetical protein
VAEVTVTVITLDGNRRHESVHLAEISPDDRLCLGRVDWRIPDELAETALYLALETRVGGEVVHRNTYYVAISPDTVHQTGLPIGEDLKLHYMGQTSTVSAPHYYTLAEIVDEPTEHDKAQKNAARDELDAVYTTTFDLPSQMTDRELELHLPGVSGDDTVHLNGEVIGKGLLNLETEWNYAADPLRWPNLPTRHYAIPAGLIREAGNEVEIRISGRRLAPYTDKRFGLTRMIHLREATPAALQERIAAYNRDKAFFRSIVTGPQVGLQLKAEAASGEGIYAVQLNNPGPASAAFVVLDLVNEGDARFVFDEGAHSALHPGQSVTVTLRIEGALPADAAVEVRMLNGPAVRCPVHAG